MKSMTCKQLGGACDEIFQATSFDEMAEKSKLHGKAMFEKNDAAHLLAMKEMQTMMKSPELMSEWFSAKKNEFDNLPEDKN